MMPSLQNQPLHEDLAQRVREELTMTLIPETRPTVRDESGATNGQQIRFPVMDTEILFSTRLWNLAN